MAAGFEPPMHGVEELGSVHVPKCTTLSGGSAVGSRWCGEDVTVQKPRYPASLARAVAISVSQACVAKAAEACERPHTYSLAHGTAGCGEGGGGGGDGSGGDGGGGDGGGGDGGGAGGCGGGGA